MLSMGTISFIGVRALPCQLRSAVQLGWSLTPACRFFFRQGWGRRFLPVQCCLPYWIRHFQRAVRFFQRPASPAARNRSCAVRSPAAAENRLYSDLSCPEDAGKWTVHTQLDGSGDVLAAQRADVGCSRLFSRLYSLSLYCRPGWGLVRRARAVRADLPAVAPAVVVVHSS